MPYVLYNSGKSSIWKDPSEDYQLKDGEQWAGDEPPVIEPAPEIAAEPTKAELLAQIQALMAKVEALP